MPITACDFGRCLCRFGRFVSSVSTLPISESTAFACVRSLFVAFMHVYLVAVMSLMLKCVGGVVDVVDVIVVVDAAVDAAFLAFAMLLREK